MTTSSLNPSRFSKRRWLWFEMLSGPVAWVTQLLLVWFVSEFGCLADTIFSSFLTYQNIAIMVGVISVSAFLTVVFGGFVSYRNWQYYKNKSLEELSGVEERSQFMTVTGLYLNALFALTIFLTGISIFFFAECEGLAA